MPENANPLPVSSSTAPEFAPEQRDLYRTVLTHLNQNGIRYVVSGAFALHTHTGIWRDTKDLDLFLTPESANAALETLTRAGFECEVRDPVWLAKAHQKSYFVDLITGMSNGTIAVEDSWIDRGRRELVLDVPCLVLGAEELIASKLFVTRRERFDGADIAHLIFATPGNLQWERVLSLAGENWEILVWHLLLFRYCYPMHTAYVPSSVWTELLDRLQQVKTDSPATFFRGTLIDPNQFRIDVTEWGLPDAEAEYRNSRTRKMTVCGRENPSGTAQPTSAA